MKIATWNVNSIRTRLGQVISWLGKNNVDVLCLQETKVIDTDFPLTVFHDMGYHTYIYGQKAYNGVALISRQPMKSVTTGFCQVLENLEPEWDDQKRVITGIVDKVRIINLYVPNGSAVGSEKYQYKLQWLAVLKTYLEVLLKSNSDIIMCGDFNIALEDVDIYKQVDTENQIMASLPERQALREILKLGFGDGFRKFNSQGGNYSWWDYRTGAFKRNSGWRIDHHYLTDVLYKQAKSCLIDISPRKLEQPSDHAPVVVEV
ncbi:exodeoxyribonuclease III [Raphidiopsis curvata NIES-932]|nr:exodeoxyribonuclease III [Raphidiopsis curvata NIES-932]